MFCGNRISPDDETAMENLARYIIRASFSQERMQYLDQEAKVVYTSKDGKATKVFDALEWGWPPCVLIYRIKVNRWSATMASTATCHGETGRRRAVMTPFLASSNRRGMKRPSGGIGRG